MNDLLIKKIIESETFPVSSLLQNRLICTFLNPVSYLDAVKHVELFENFDYIFADGSLMVSMIRSLYKKKVLRRSFDMTSMAKMIFESLSKTGKSVFFVGSTQDVIEKTVSMLAIDYPSLRVAGYRNGFFDTVEEKEGTIQKILSVSPDVVIVGMGVLNQEKFLLQLKDAGFQGTGFTCGGFLHQYAVNGKQYYPNWINKYNLRFFYRMYKEPYTIKRYAKAFFVFPIYVLKNKFAKHR